MKKHRSTILNKSLATFLFCFISGTVCAEKNEPASPTESAIETQTGDVTLYAAGDIANCSNGDPASSIAAKTAAIIVAGLAHDKDASVLTMGDNTYPSGLAQEFADCYAPTWGQFKTRTHPAPGNHEYYTPGAIGYFSYFGELAGPSQRGYYSFDVGHWHVVSLNSNLADKEIKAQLNWLRSDLAQHKTRCTLAYWHHPVYSSGGHGNNIVMLDAWKILQTAGADLVLTGHDHDYERFSPQDANGNHDEKHGMREFVVGTGGAKLTMLLFRKPNSEISAAATAGVLKLVLKADRYEWEFMPTAGATFSDRGEAVCH